ncbi:PAN domain-containing protein [Purpureocillium lilacinum]|nr:PAN domain-containing protein [Purpureocillium lilacinum]OAQ77780.1 PAN domain-containing protein [Purpureocillium lilacinum]OAQ85213.1 PAN domain-containing protein [Purpureocillium lilacinum]GJN74754.1 hypothetical protein PLICBS_008847 [Purpureocillium lilacinum]GJN86227.1 hypothetical protein PLIIFM63780_009806 [Purpureocillium lilacinum]
MQAKLLALLAAHAAAIAVPSEPDVTIDYKQGLAIPRDIARLVKERDVCNADNCLRNLRDKRYSSSASAFCSTFIQSTVVNTQYAIATDHKTNTETPPPVTVTNVIVDDLLNPTATEIVTQYSTIPDPRYKRGAQPYPTWLSASYPPERVSSACSCFIPSPSPAIQQTVTLTTSTETVVAVETLPPVTNTVDVTSTHTIDVVATQTATVGVTCGIKGCVWGNDLLLQSTGSLPNIAACKALCTSNAQCQSFQWSEQYKYCNIGKAPATQFWATPSCSEFKVYDVACSI